jgi:hypothetical protein
MEDFNVIPIECECKISEEKLHNLEVGYPSGWGNDDDVISDKKKIPQCPGMKYGLKAVLKKNDDNDEVLYMKLCFYGSFDDELTIHGKFACFVKSANFATSFDSFTYAHDVCVNGDEYDDWAHEICTKGDLFNPEKKFIFNKHMVVEMKGMLFVKEIVYPSFFKKPSSTLGDYLWERDDKDFIISGGKEGDESKTEIKVHKFVLASRSPVFDKMIETDMKEKREGKVEIVDFDPDTVEAAVEYCYDQDITYRCDDLTIALPLLQFAEKYDMNDLKKEIETYLIKESLSPENVVEISNAAIISNSPILRRFCSDALLIFMRQGIQVEKRDVLDGEFAKELLDKALSGECSVDEKIFEEVKEENFVDDIGWG